VAVIDSGSSSAGKANVDANYNLKVNLPTDPDLVGGAFMVSQIDNGTVLGSVTTKALEVTQDYRLRVGMDTVLFNLAFEGTNIARDRIQQNDTTATSAQASGFLTLNSGSSVTSGQGSNVRTYRTFPLFGSYTTYGEFWCREGNPTATNAITEFGFGYVSGVTAQATDGAFFRRLAGGQLRAVIVNNSTDIQTADITPTNIPARDGTGTYDATEVSHYIIAVHNDDVEFWINDVLVAQLQITSTVPSPASALNQPMFARVYNSGTASAARSLSVGYMTASLGEAQAAKPWGHQMTGQGGGAYQIQPGTASGPTTTRGASPAGWPTSATASAAGTWTATSAPATNSLGGIWVSPAISTLTTAADYPVFSYQNPAGTSTLPGKTLYITGVRWGKTVASTAASTNSVILHYIVGVGSTTSATNATEAAAAIAARGIVVDTIPFIATSALGDFREGGELNLGEAPLVVPPGAYVQWIVRPVGTVTSNTLTVTSTVAFVGYSE